MENEKNININQNENSDKDFKMEEFKYSPEADVLREKIISLHKKDVNLTMDKIALFGRELQSRYSIKELHNYETYCVLVGSTPLKKPEKFDLEGDSSIAQFIDKLAKEVGE